MCQCQSYKQIPLAATVYLLWAFFSPAVRNAHHHAKSHHDLPLLPKKSTWSQHSLDKQREMWSISTRLLSIARRPENFYHNRLFSGPVQIVIFGARTKPELNVEDPQVTYKRGTDTFESDTDTLQILQQVWKRYISAGEIKIHIS